MPVSALCEDEQGPAPETLMALLDRLQDLRRHVRCSTSGGLPDAEAVAALRAEMRALIQTTPWHATILQHAWSRLHLAMTSSLIRQQRQARRYSAALGYSLATLRDLWGHLYDLYTRVETAKQELTTRNLRLVISVAREFLHTGVPLTDLVQEGNIGLMRAVNKFDYQRNLKFSTYAVWWIKQAIRRAVYDQMALIRVPEYMYESARQVQKIMPVLATELGRTPTPGEMAQRLDLPLERVERSLALTHEPVSLDQTQAGVRERPFQERVADTEATQGLETVLQQDLQQHTQQALSCLKPREAEVLRRRFGLDGYPGETLRQIGLDLALSHERVRQIEAQALAKLKAESPGLREYLEI
jgi:RNA polymerase sigma factor (sigma-70 family)